MSCPSLSWNLPILGGTNAAGKSIGPGTGPPSARGVTLRHKGHKDHEDHKNLVIFVIFVVFVPEREIRERKGKGGRNEDGTQSTLRKC
jgi:hypothetical protein